MTFDSEIMMSTNKGLAGSIIPKPDVNGTHQ